jgi:hypothetical protein
MGLHPTGTAARASKPPKRIYTDEEKDFLKWTTSSTHYAPVHRPRPESITDDDIVAAINAKRRICSLGPIDTDPNWNKATLSADPVDPPASRYPVASASGLPSSAEPATLPTLNAVACPERSRRVMPRPVYFKSRKQQESPALCWAFALSA